MKPTKHEFLAAIAAIEKLSPAPRVLCRALPLLRDPNCDLRDVVELIKVDTALTADIIRGANSAFYGVDDRVSSLDRAVQKIGLRESFRLLNLAVTHIFAARDLGSYGISADEFWAESLFHGLFLQELARVTGGYDADTANTLGLLRFIGRLAINQSIADLGVGLFWREDMPLSQWELESVGFTQNYAAGVLLRAWHFPELLCDAIEHQSEPEKAAPANWLAQALDFAGQVVPARAWEEVECDAADAAELAFAQNYGLSPSRIASLVVDTRAAYHSISEKLYD